jgi:diguanylate cyclase (GGDEF)-like protein
MTTVPRAAGGRTRPVTAGPVPGTSTDAAPARPCQTCGRATTDGLTGVLDRHEWDRRAAHAVAAARSHGLPLALVLADLDRFKEVNDSHGHVAGDAVLRAVGAVLGAVEGAVVGRYGRHTGDEFLLLLPGATAEEALAAARRAQDAVRNLAVTARSGRSTTVRLTGRTVSMGVAAGPPPGGGDWGVADLLLDADEALRAAKRAGGDRARTAGAAAGAPPGTAGTAAPRRPSAPPRGTDELRIPLAPLGHEAAPEGELVLSTEAATRLHAVLTELLAETRAAAAAP